MVIRNLIVLAAGVALAYVSAAAAIASSLASANPVVAASMPAGSGMAKARLARLLVARDAAYEQRGDGSGVGEFPTAISPGALRLARSAYREEPLATDALTTIALDYNARQESSKARELFGYIQEITKRDEVVSLWLALDSARRNDVGGAMTYFDQLLRTSSASRGVLLRRLAAFSASPQLRGALLEKIRSNPPWLPEFWAAGVVDPATAVAVGQILKSLAPNVVVDASVKERLAVNLLQSGNETLAQDLYRAFAQSAARGLVDNPNFDAPSFFPPIDWQAYSTGSYSAEISPAEKAMFVSATGYPAGVAARQFVRLDPGSYRLVVTSRLFAVSEGEGVDVKLSCRLDSALAPIILRLVNGTAAREFTRPRSCAGYFLDVEPVTKENTAGFDAEILSIDIARI